MESTETSATESNPPGLAFARREEPVDEVRVLLVGDEPAELRSLEGLLAPLGCACIRASNGEEALAQLAARSFAAVLMDAALPSIDAGRTPLLLICDAGLKPALILRAHSRGNVDCLFRPLVPELLRARVSILVELQRKAQELQAMAAEKMAAVELHRSIFEEQSVRLAGEASARNLRALSESLPQQVWSADAQGHLNFVNNAVLRYFDRNASEVLGDGWLEMIHPGDLERVGALWAQSLQTGEDYEIEFRLRRFDGTHLWHLGRARAIRNADGEIVRWLGTNTEIDDQIRARERIEESARSFRALADTIPQMCFAATPSGQFDYFNPQWLEYTGQALDKEPQRDAWQGAHEPGAYPLVAKRWRESLVTGATFEMETPLRRASDGEYRLHLTRAVALRDAQGRITRWFGTCTDVHDQRQQVFKRLEWEARERQLRHVALRADVSVALTKGSSLREMLQSCCESLVQHLGGTFARVWTVGDSNMLELQASAGRYTHIDGEHSRISIGQKQIGLIAQEKRPHVTNDVLNDERLSDKAWAEREGLVSFAGYPLLSADRLIGVIAMFARRPLDIDSVDAISSIADVIAQGIARKQVEEELERHVKELARSNSELERFSYVASHDLQEPLRMIASYTQLLGRRYQGKLDADADEFIAFAVDGAQRMQTLINDLLAFSRVATRPGVMTPTDLEPTLATALLNLRGAIEEKHAIVTHDPLPMVLAYDRQLIQLFQNLIGNAIKFGKKDEPRVHIGAVKQGDEWRISVKDNGIGIDPAFFDRLFVVFQRLNSRSEYAGNGIGLAICKKIVERHGGRIWVEAKPGEGATFFFTLKETTP